MLYLEDYLEMIEHLPQELRDRFTEMRELDLSVQNIMDTLDKRVKELFFACRRPDADMDQANVEFGDIQKGFNKAIEDADEKVQLANDLYELVTRYIRRLDTELHKFKCELEADNKGITELLEKRSLELDAPPMSAYVMPQHGASHHQPKDRYRIRPDKRRDSWAGSVNSMSGGGGANNRTSESGLGMAMPTNANRGEGRTLVAATAPLALQRSDLALQAVVGRAVTENNNYSLVHMGAGTAIAAAASQAIVATQQMQQGRRTASLKASYEAIHSGGGGVGIGAAVLGGPELQVGRDLAGAAHQAIQAVQNQEGIGAFASVTPTNIHLHSHSSSHASSANRRHKKKSSYTAGSSNNYLLPQQQTLASSISRSSSPTQTVGNVGVSNAAPITSMPLEESIADGDWALDPNEPRYCTCNQVSYGDMVACDNEDCPYEWFHYPCVGVTAPPKGKWYCPQCLVSMRRRGNRKN